MAACRKQSSRNIGTEKKTEKKTSWAFLNDDPFLFHYRYYAKPLPHAQRLPHVHPVVRVD